MINLAAIKAVAIKALTFCKNLITATGPLAVVSRVLSIGAITVTVVKLVKKLIQKIKSHKKAKSPETTTEYALADEKIRENAPAETKAKYEASVEKTANKLVGKSKKKRNAKKGARDKSIKEMIDALDEIRGDKYSKVESGHQKSVSELLDTDPALHEWAFGTPLSKKKVCHA